MRLVYVTASLPYGTTEVFAIPELQELVSRGHEVRLVPMSLYTSTPHSDAQPFVPLTHYQPLAGSTVLRVGASELAARPGGALRALTRTLRRQQRKIVPKNLSVFPRALWLARFARTWGADHIHAYWASVPATAAMIAGEVSGVPWSFTAHRWDIVEPNALAAKVASARFARFISQDGLDLAKPVVGASLNTKATIIRMGVRLDAQEARRAAPPEGTDLRVVCAASLIPRKGQSYLLEALARLRERGLHVTASLAGEGEARVRLEAKAQELGVDDRVTLLGNVDHSELLRRYAVGDFDAFVLPSLHEGIAVSVLEAMSYGLPVVATEVGGMPELLSGGVGLLVPPKDPERLAQAMGRLARDPELRTRLGETGRARVLDEYDVTRVVDSLLEKFSAAARP